MSLKRICASTGCIRLIDIGSRYCEKHSKTEQERQAGYDKAVRNSRDKLYHTFYCSSEWQTAATIVKARYGGLCVWSYYHGAIAPCEEVHHIEPIKEAWDDRLRLDMLIPLTHEVHMQIEAKYRKGSEQEIKQQLKSYLEQWAREFRREGW